MAKQKQSDNGHVSEEQLQYAHYLEIGMYIGLLVLLITFVIYALGIVAPYIPLKDISNFWRMPVSEYLHEGNIPAGWGWAGMLRYSDFLNFIGIAILAGVTIFCYIGIIPSFLKTNDKVYATLALAEAIILTVAASGIITVGGH